jgi:phage terminase large subunit-like protein
MLIDGFKGRAQPLLLAITNSGFDRTSICWEWHAHAVAVMDGLRNDDELFAYVMALDPGEDPLELDPKKTEMTVVAGETVPLCWLKTNPGLGQTITVAYLRSQVNDGIAIPGRENQVRRLNFCEWTDSDKGWMTRKSWTEIERPLVEFVKGVAVPGPFGKDADDKGLRAKCYLGLDLSFSFDLTALAFAFPEYLFTEQGHQLFGQDGHPLTRLACWIEYFTPKDTAREREQKDRVNYTKWIDNGLVHGVAGPVIRIEHIARRIAEVTDEYEVVFAAYDRYRHKALADQMAENGAHVPWIEHPQGFRRGGQLDGKDGNPLIIGKDGKPVDNPLWMPSSVDALERRIIEKSIEVQESEVTRWQVSSVVIRDDPSGAGNRIFNKAKAVGRIDGTVALAQAVGAAEMRLPSVSLSGFLANPVMTR